MKILTRDKSVNFIIISCLFLIVVAAWQEVRAAPTGNFECVGTTCVPFTASWQITTTDMLGQPFGNRSLWGYTVVWGELISGREQCWVDLGVVTVWDDARIAAEQACFQQSTNSATRHFVDIDDPLATEFRGSAQMGQTYVWRITAMWQDVTDPTVANKLDRSWSSAILYAPTFSYGANPLVIFIGVSSE